MTDRRKYNPGQPKKDPQEKKVPLTFHVKLKNKAAIKISLQPVVKKLDI